MSSMPGYIKHVRQKQKQETTRSEKKMRFELNSSLAFVRVVYSSVGMAHLCTYIPR